jgi:hypothetical protein
MNTRNIDFSKLPESKTISSLFDTIPYPSIVYRSPSEKDYAAVTETLKYFGITEKITSIQQPVGSAEISSQNFTIATTNRVLQLRRCNLFKGKEKFRAMAVMLAALTADGVRVPEFDYPSEKVISDEPYFEMTDKDNVTSGWTFYKHINAQSYFPGLAGIAKVAYQLGKLHACLKREYGKQLALPQDTDSAYVNYNVPYFPKTAWLHFQKLIADSKWENGEKVYDEYQELITSLVTLVEDNFSVLQDPDDIQNIHFDLNATNILNDKNNDIYIMDFDGTKLGNIYNDIGMLFARTFTVCIERVEVTENNFGSQLLEFIKNYTQGNPEFKFDINKLIIALYDRALCNVHAGLRFKYDTKDSPWTAGIPLNLKRLEQVNCLAQLVLKSELLKKYRAESTSSDIASVHSFWTTDRSQLDMKTVTIERSSPSPTHQ